jgi:hypothetical protein
MLRRAMVATAVPPFASLYRLPYQVALLRAVHVLRRFPAVKSVYLRHSFATGKILPGLSDVDLVIMADYDDPTYDAYETAWDRLQRSFPLLEANTNALWSPRFLPRAVEASWLFQQYWSDNQDEWRLLHGRDCRSELPVMGPERMGAVGYVEMAVGWSMFARKLLGGRRYERDPLVQASVCCKMTAQVLKGALALERGILARSRDEAAALCGELSLSDHERELVGMTRRLLSGRLLGWEPNLINRTAAFMFPFVDRVVGTTPQSQLQPLRPAPFQVDAPTEELDEACERDAAGRLADCARRLWGDTLRAVYLIPALLTPVGKLILVLEIDPETPPSGEAVNAFARDAEGMDLGRILDLFILQRHAALQVGIGEFKGTHHRILSPRLHPEVFTLLQRQDRRIYGEGKPPPAPAFLTPAMGEIVRSDLLRAEVNLETAARHRNLKSGTREFWKALQLSLVAPSLEGDAPCYPLTRAAIERGLHRFGLTLPGELSRLGRGPCRDGTLGDALRFITTISRGQS